MGQSTLIKKNKKGQGWGLDLMVASTIFLLGIFSIYMYTINYGGDSENILNSLKSQARLSSSLILSEGTPKNWEGLNITKTPGILTNEKVNKTKLYRFYNITNTEKKYKRTKTKLGIHNNNEFYFNFTNMDVNGKRIRGIGKKPQDTKNMYKLERIIIHNNKIKKFNVYLWN